MDKNQIVTFVLGGIFLLGMFMPIILNKKNGGGDKPE